MTLTPPAHICGSLGHLRGRKHPLTAERLQWVAEAVKAGHHQTKIAAALGIGIEVTYTLVRTARKRGLLPWTQKPAPAAQAVRGVRVAPGKSVVHFPGSSGESRVSLAAMPGDEAELRPDPRHETNPRFTLVRVQPRPERRADVAGAIAAIRKVWEARA